MCPSGCVQWVETDAWGTQALEFGTLQYGGRIAERTSYRIFASYQNNNHFPDLNGRRSLQGTGSRRVPLKPIRQSELREAIARALGAREQKGAIPMITRYSLHDAREPSASLRILLEEDNAVNQRLASRLLEKRGHFVLVAGNGREALAALEKESFDLVLMDMQKPVMDGFEATAAIRKKERATGTHLPVVALTAHAMQGDREKCLAGGMDGYLTKPIRPQELDEILQTYLTPRAKTKEAQEPTMSRK
jgi:two-component system, sensor histidine kinase and response regulator